MLKYVQEASKSAEVAITIAEASQTAATRASAVVALTDANKALKKVNEVKGVYDKNVGAAKQIVQSAGGPTPPSNPLSQFSSASKGPANELIESSRVAEKAWEDAIKLLQALRRNSTGLRQRAVV